MKSKYNLFNLLFAFLIIAALQLFSLPAFAQNVNPDVKSDWITFAQNTKDAGNITVAVSPSYAPNLKNESGKSDPWGAGLSLTYRIPANGVLGHTFAGVQLDYIGSKFLSVGVAGGITGSFQVKNQNFDMGAYGGAVKAVSGTDTTEWGLMTGTFMKTTVKSWDNLLGIGPARIDVGCAVEKWDKFAGVVIRPGVAFSVVFK